MGQINPVKGVLQNLSFKVLQVLQPHKLFDLNHKPVSRKSPFIRILVRFDPQTEIEKLCPFLVRTADQINPTWSAQRFGPVLTQMFLGPLICPQIFAISIKSYFSCFRYPEQVWRYIDRQRTFAFIWQRRDRRCNCHGKLFTKNYQRP